MAYILTADLIARFGETEVRELSDRCRPPVGEIDEAVCARAIADACAVVDRNIGGRYAVPLVAPLPVDIARVTADIARYFLHDAGAPDQVRRHYEDAIGWLEDVGRGRMDLVNADGSMLPTKATPSGSGVAVVKPYQPDAIFGDAFAGQMDPATVYAAGTTRGWTP